jgi:hypothetical protein
MMMMMMMLHPIHPPRTICQFRLLFFRNSEFRDMCFSILLLKFVCNSAASHLLLYPAATATNVQPRTHDGNQRYEECWY